MRFAAFLLNPHVIGLVALFLSVIWMLRDERDKTRPVLVIALVINLFYGFLLNVVMGQENGLVPWKYDHVLAAVDASLGLNTTGIAAALQGGWKLVLVVVYDLMVPMMIVWYLAGRHQNESGSVIVAYIAEMLVGPLLYAIVPACGPLYAFRAAWLHPPAVRAELIRLSGMPNAFPSLHLGTAVIFVFFSRTPGWRWASLAMLAGTALATLSTGEHYAIDLVAGTVSVVEPEAMAPTSAQFFYMYYGDRRGLIATDNRTRDLPAGQTCSTGNNRYLIRNCDHSDIAISTIGIDAIHVVDIGSGKMDVLVWVAGQFGDWQALGQNAWAYVTEAGYQLTDVAWKPWLRLGFARASGDQDKTDHDHNTFFQMIPTARLYALFPFYNMMNNQDLFAQGIVRPLPGLSVTTSGHWLRATESADLWYSGGGATSNTFFGYAGIATRGRHELSYLADLEISYTINSHLTCYAYYGRALGQAIASANFAGTNADYGYIETTVSF